MSVFCIGPEERAALLRAKERARDAATPLAVLERVRVGYYQHRDVLTLEDRRAAPELIRPASEHVSIPHNYRAAVSYEHQPLGLCAHVSLSVGEPGRVPRPEAMVMLAEALGVAWPPETMWVEEFEIDGRPGGRAVNALFLEEKS